MKKLQAALEPLRGESLQQLGNHLRHYFNDSHQSMLRCFISYAKGDKRIEAAVSRLATLLDYAGFHIEIDLTKNQEGTFLHLFSRQIKRIDRVIVCGTPLLKQKYDVDKHLLNQPLETILKKTTHVVSLELKQIIERARAEYRAHITQQSGYRGNIFPVLLEGTPNESFPPGLRPRDEYGLVYLDHRQQDDKTLWQLIHALYRTGDNTTLYDLVEANYLQYLEKRHAFEIAHMQATVLKQDTITLSEPPIGVRYWGRPFPEEHKHTLLRPALWAAILNAYQAEPDRGTCCCKVVLTGLGGVGKTQLALQYAYQSPKRYTFIVWLRAKTSLGFLHDYIALGQSIGAMIDERALFEVQARQVAQQLSTMRNWLLIIDNLDASCTGELVLGSLPQQGGDILITGRYRVPLLDATHLTVGPMPIEEGVHCLQARLPHEPTSVLKALTIALDGFPLALSQAAAYIQEQMRAAQYLGLLISQRNRDDLLQEVGLSGEARSVMKILSSNLTGFSRALRGEPGARSLELLLVCAYLSADGVPKSLLADYLNHTLFLEEEETGSALGKQGEHQKEKEAGLTPACLLVNRALKPSLQYSLLSGDQDQVKMHCLLQSVVQKQGEWLYQGVLKRSTQSGDEIISKMQAKFDSQSGRLVLLKLSDFLTQAILPKTPLMREVRRRASLLPQITALLEVIRGIYLNDGGQFDQSFMFYYTALLDSTQKVYASLGQPQFQKVILKILLGLQKKHTPESQLAIGQTEIDWSTAEMNLGDPKKALSLAKSGLSRLKRSGEDSLKYVKGLNAMARAYRHLGQANVAKSVSNEALSQLAKQAPLGVAERAQALSNLGCAELALGQMEASCERLEMALSLNETHYGEGHYQVALSLTRLGEAYYRLGSLEKSVPLLEVALKIDEGHYGENHYAVGATLIRLGELYHRLGAYRRSEKLLERALVIQKKHYGESHYQVAKVLFHLGLSQGGLGRQSVKKALLREALRIQEGYYGKTHPEVKETLRALSTVKPAIDQMK